MALDTNWSNRLIADLMADFDLTLPVATGIVGSLAMESKGFTDWQEDSPVIPGSRGGAGMAQWTGVRRDAYEKYAKDRGLDINSYEAQYGYLREELNGVGNHDNNIIAKLKAAGEIDAGQAAQIFTGSAASGAGFLRPGIVHMGSRLTWTSQVGNGYVKLPPSDLPR